MFEHSLYQAGGRINYLEEKDSVCALKNLLGTDQFVGSAFTVVSSTMNRQEDFLGWTMEKASPMAEREIFH